MNVILGTVQFGLDYGATNKNGQVGFAEVCNILAEAKRNNIEMLDTSTQYGSSEEVIGRASSELRTTFSVVTKSRSFQDLSKAEALNALNKDFEQSVLRLKDNRMHAYMLHNADDLVSEKADDLYRALQSLKDRNGFKIGLSVYDPEQLRLILQNYDVDIVQLPLNIFDRRFLELLPILKKKGIEVHTRSAFLQGVLLDNKNLSGCFLAYESYFIKYNQLIQELGLNPLQACLGFVSCYSNNVVLGVSSLKEFDEIIKARGCDKHDRAALSKLEKFNLPPTGLIDPRLWN